MRNVEKKSEAKKEKEKPKTKNPWLSRAIIYLVLALWPYVLLLLYLILTFPKEGKQVCILPGIGLGSGCSVMYVCEAVKSPFLLIALCMLAVSIVSYIISKRNRVLSVIALEFSFSMMLGFLFGFLVNRFLADLLLGPLLGPLGFTC
jgi:hypothetical protein